MQIDPFVEDLLKSTADMWMHPPQDVRRMQARNAETGREFPVWCHVYGDLKNLADLLYDALVADVDDVPPVSGAFLRRTLTRYAGGLSRIGHLTDCADVLEQASEHVPLVYGSPAERRRFLRILQRYLLQLLFWVDMSFPWAQVSSLVHEQWPSGSEGS